MRRYTLLLSVLGMMVTGCVTTRDPCVLYPEEYRLAMEAPVLRVFVKGLRGDDDTKAGGLGLGSAIACGDVVRTADHVCTPEDDEIITKIFVDGIETEVLELSKRLHEYDDAATMVRPPGITAEGNCRKYRPPVGSRVWLVGYPGSAPQMRMCCPKHDRRRKRALQGWAMEFTPPEENVILVAVNLEGKGHGMSGGPARTMVDGEMVDFGTTVGYRELPKGPHKLACTLNLQPCLARNANILLIVRLYD